MNWEYKVVHFPAASEDSEMKLNQLGKQGWELACAMPIRGVYGEEIEVYLKRPIAPLVLPEI